MKISIDLYSHYTRTGDPDDASPRATAGVHQQAARRRVHRRLLPREQPQCPQETRRRTAQVAALAT